MATVTKPLALNESLNSTENTPRNIADVLADELDGIKQAISSQSGSGDGHIIQNSAGANMPQENTMQFVDAHLSDDSVGGKTVVETFKAVTEAEYSSETEDGAYIVTDGDGATIGEASDDIEEVTGNGSKTYATLLNELYAKIDKTKLTPYSKIVLISQYGTMQYDVVFYTNSTIIASQSNASANDLNTDTAILSSASTYYQYRNGSSQDASSTVLNNGGKITLYYGNRKAVVDLQTTANRCWYDSNTTVKQKIDTITPQITKVTQNALTVTANTSVTTDIDFESIDTSKILMVQITWSNSASDNPVAMIPYAHNTSYINKVTHKWSVNQTVNFYALVLHT